MLAMSALDLILLINYDQNCQYSDLCLIHMYSCFQLRGFPIQSNRIAVLNLFRFHTEISSQETRCILGHMPHFLRLYAVTRLFFGVTLYSKVLYVNISLDAIANMKEQGLIVLQNALI